jgi:hypothetical protein
MQDDIDRRLEVPNTTPTNDTAAHILRWVGLVGGLGLCALGIASVLA